MRLYLGMDIKEPNQAKAVLAIADNDVVAVGTVARQSTSFAAALGENYRRRCDSLLASVPRVVYICADQCTIGMFALTYSGLVKLMFNFVQINRLIVRQR